jgi:hypothetical protein
MPTSSSVQTTERFRSRSSSCDSSLGGPLLWPAADRQREPEGQEIAVTAKIDPKRELRQLYSARAAPELVVVPELSFL